MFRPAFTLILAALLAAVVAGCGFKGPLVLAPEQPAKKTPAATPAPPPSPTSQPGTSVP